MITIQKLKDRFYYSMESIRNRYPCKMIKVKNLKNDQKKTTIVYQAVTKINLREETIQEILNDPMLTEKFHPTECVKLGFLSAGEILIKNQRCPPELKAKYEEIVTAMFSNLEEGDGNDAH